ncbi:hypothetical protein [Rhizobium sp. SL42]|uniref:hypothetical protein n=1 Tax=Rhizobium sp. SL42 TaxID=2806346 RepID=UPI001F349F6D|nr:hypothetical protein [Rhizobium sp. SL42]UJW74301.1 hypothetical protein IM739_15735 [Rhizobium sp. SL42]
MNCRLMLLSTVAFLAAVSLSPSHAQSTKSVTAASIQTKINAIFPFKGELLGLFHTMPVDNGFDVVFDTPRLLELLRGIGLRAEGATPLTSRLEPLPDGSFKIEQEETLSIKGNIAKPQGPLSFYARIDSLKSSAIAEPELRYLKTAESEMTNLVVDLQTPTKSSHRTADKWTITQSTSNVENGRLDLVSTSVELGRRDKENLESMDVDRIESTTTIKSLPYRAIQDLFAAWLKQAQDGKPPAAIAGSLREEIRMLMPVATQIDMQGRAENTRLGQPEFNFGIGSIDYDVVWKDLTRLSNLDIKLKLEDTDTAGQLQPSYAALIPDTITVDMSVGGINVQNAWRYYFSTVDFATPFLLNTYQRNRATSYLVPNDVIPVKVEELKFNSELYSVRMFGNATYRIGDSLPKLELRVITPSLDPLITHFQKHAKVNPQLGEAAFFALMAKGFAGKAGNGWIYWDLAIAEDGRLTVNGHDFTPPRTRP